MLLAGLCGVLAGAPAVLATTATSQQTSDELNQLFVFETTPNKSAQGEGYFNAAFAYLRFRDKVFQYRYQVQAQYSFTDQFAIGGFIPLIHAKLAKTNTGFGDLTFYGQYKLDQIIPHNFADVTAQVDIVLPTGKKKDFRDTGHFGVRPWLEAFKDLGPVGPGHLGAYGEAGFTITQDSDFRFGFAGTYDWNNIMGILEFYDQTGGKIGRPFITFSPGLSFHPWPFEFTLGFPIGLNDNSPRWGVILKGTVAW